MSSTNHFNTGFIGREILHFPTLDSTNTYLKELINGGNVDQGLVVSTDYQTSGRGQIGNSWHSEASTNLLMSIFLRPHQLKAADSFTFNMSVCLAVADALNGLNPGFKVKWPNDILFDGKKVCGILIETSLQGQYIQHAIVGIGLNVNQLKFAGETSKASSLFKILGHKLEIEYVRNLIFRALEKRYFMLQGNALQLKRDYFSHLYGYKEMVPAIVDDRRTEVSIVNVLDDGRLDALVEGKHQLFQFKEISFIY